MLVADAWSMIDDSPFHREAQRPHRGGRRWPLVSLCYGVGATAAVSGVGLVVSPDGALLRAPRSLLAQVTPWDVVADCVLRTVSSVAAGASRVPAGTSLAPTTSMIKSPVQVVVGFDFTRSAREALSRAISLVSRAPFHVLHIACAIEPHRQIEAVPHRGHADFAYVEHVERALLDEIAAELKAASINDQVHFFVHVRLGRAAAEILALASEIGADLIIVGSSGHVGIERLVLGSVSEQVVREAGCTVEVARPKTYDHVELLAMTEVEPHRSYVPPHRYRYDSRCLNLRPDEWPLY